MFAYTSKFGQKTSFFYSLIFNGCMSFLLKSA
nr:MAG TPA: hypothetical protein [Caudoviricetes sp.]